MKEYRKGKKKRERSFWKRIRNEIEKKREK